MPLEANFQVFQSFMFAYHILHKVTMMEQLQSNYMVTTCIMSKLEELGGPRDCNPKWRAPKSRGETHLRVSQSQVAESWTW
jgi:hypothetical protein